MLGIPEIVVCAVCGTSGPSVPDQKLIVRVENPGGEALKAGWHAEPEGWICPACFTKRLQVSDL